MSLPRQILTALTASLAASIAGLLINIGSMFFELINTGEGDPRLMAGAISGETLTAVLGLLPLAIFGLVFWRVLIWLSQKLFGPSRSLLRQLAIGVGVFVFGLIFVELVSLTQYQNHQFLEQAGFGDLLFILSSGATWGLVFWWALKTAPSKQGFIHD